ncbi:MAG: hypothetical protein K9G62_04490 [Alphaproteobacteria bacterium]|nr:hypothetical protein [Alphaproteobacteria bacterium]
MNHILQWIDLIWLPLGWIVVAKDQRWLVAGILFGCMTMMRLQAELMDSIGYSTGMLPYLELQDYERGLLIYSLFYAVFLGIVHFSPQMKGALLLGAGLSLFFMVFTTAGLIMLI